MIFEETPEEFAIGFIKRLQTIPRGYDIIKGLLGRKRKKVITEIAKRYYFNLFSHGLTMKAAMQRATQEYECLQQLVKELNITL